MANDFAVLTVTELTRRIKGIIEKQFINLSVQGEISNCKLHSSGHLYFTLKDDRCQIQAVMWRNRVAGLSFTPQDGMKVIAAGNISVYEVRGVYQIDVAFLQPAGLGELQLAFERLKQRLATEGLFDQAHKKPIPSFPMRIGIVTSPTGAAIQDILNIIGRRFPGVQLILNPVKVQGSGAAGEIAGAIAEFNRYGEIDVMIVGRGGGSLEDLWAFNEEVVARAIYNSAIPVISAVGHEIDFTIADFVADLRAPTPSAAAELVVRNRTEIIEFLRDFQYTAEQNIGELIDSQRLHIKSLLQSYSFNRPVDLLRQYSQRLDEITRTLGKEASQRLRLLNEKLLSYSSRITSLNPDAVLHRGYAIVISDQKLIIRARQLEHGDDVNIRFHDGIVPAKVK